MIAYTRQGAKTSDIGRGGICTPTDCIGGRQKGIKGELRAKREREALSSKGAGEPTLDYMATGMGLQVVELEGRLEVMKESQEERQILEIGQAAPQSPSKQPGETEMEGRRDFERRPANGMIVRRPKGGSTSTTATTPVPQAPVSSATPTATTLSPTSEPVIAAQESQQTLTAQEGSSAVVGRGVVVREGGGRVGRLSCDEWFVIIGFVTSQESICMWLLSRKTRAAMELFGARLVRGSGWVHSGVFDNEEKSGRG